MSTISKNKDELYESIHMSFKKLLEDYQVIPSEYTRIIAIQGNIKNTQITVCDTMAYLIGWGKLVLKWYDRKTKNLIVDFLKQVLNGMN